MVITVINSKGSEFYTVKLNELAHVISVIAMTLTSFEFYKQIGDNAIYDAVNDNGNPITIVFTDNL